MAWSFSALKVGALKRRTRSSGASPALKAAEVKLSRLYAPPSETNFGGGLLGGTQSACEAACAAFRERVAEVAAQPRE